MSDQAPADWTATLPEEIKPIVQTKGWKSPADIIGSYTNLEKTLGQKRLPTPSNDWKPEQWDGFYKELGRPDKPDDYKVPDYKFPDGVNFDENRINEAKKMLHRHGLTPRQAEGLLKDHFETISKEAAATFEARQREQEAAEFRLKDEWKGDYDVNVKAAKDALSKFGSPELVSHLNETGLGNHPELVKMFANIAKGMMEDTARGRSNQAGPLSGEAAKAAFEKLTKDQAFMQKFMTGDKEASKQYYDALNAAHPVEKA